jgi:putative aminopeptidase FrvX
MRDESFKFLKKLVAAPSPSGYEQPAQRVFRDYVEHYAEISTDVLGNVVSFIPGQGDNRLKVMLVAHCDEIGFQVKYIDDNGYIWFSAVGGVDPHITIGQRVIIHGSNGTVAGVIGRKPIHLLDAKDRDSVIKLDNQYIDIGVANRKEAEELIRLGDPVTFAAELMPLQGDRVASRGFDDKAGCFVVAEVMRLVAESGQPLPVDLYGVSSVQEEVGLRGGKTSSYSVNPDVGICVEVYFSSDQPDVDKKLNGEICLGKGPVIPRGLNINPFLFDLLTSTAGSQEIPVQVISIPRATGTDANVMQVSRSGVATALVTLPLRYMHSPVEVVSLSDLEQAARLIVASLSGLTDREVLIPR